MAFSRLLNQDEIVPLHRVFHADADGDNYTIETKHDVTELVDFNNEHRKLTDKHTKYGDGMERVASIPMVIWQKLKTEGVIDDKAAFKRWLNDPDNRVFRVREGRV